LFTERLPRLDQQSLVNRKYIYKPTVHTNTIIPAAREMDFIVVQGGHEFKDPNMLETDFIQQKCKFYHWLQTIIHPKLLKQIPWIPSRSIGVHVRNFVEKYDAADGRVFEEVSPLNEFVKLVLKIHKRCPTITFVLCSNNTNAYEALSGILPKNKLWYRTNKSVERDTELGIQDAIIDILTLSRCKMIIGTTMSSFSDEACFFGSIPKICMGAVRKESSYHCYGYSNIQKDYFLIPHINEGSYKLIDELVLS